MLYPKIELAQTVIAHCKQANINHIVLSPGSRNAPLTLGFTNSDFFNCYSIVDERSAAFFALGLAQSLNEPTALVCTSGSALLNYFPAVAEAYYSQIPLVIISADRPPELVDIGDGQTINQPNVYGKHVLKSVNLKEGNHNFTFNDNALLEVLELAKVESGPVHINCPFSEPLYETTTQNSVKIGTPKDKTLKDVVYNYQDVYNSWQSYKKIIVLIGVLKPTKAEVEYINLLRNQPNVIILKETTSNILDYEDVISCIDRVIAPLSETDFKSLQADLVVTIGGFIISKKIKQFLRQYSPEAHWHIGESRANNTFFKLKKHFKVDCNSFFKPLFNAQTNLPNSRYKKKWLAINEQHLNGHFKFLKQIEYSDLKVFETLLDTLPAMLNLHLSNSTVIRYTQLFGIKQGVNVFCNRGTSGIDGSTSTAIGYAAASQLPTLLITGDLSFFYDSNALWNNYIPSSFRIILVNNSGGGIFRVLPADKTSDNFDTFFETSHNLDASHLCKMYDFEYENVANLNELNTVLKSFYDGSDKPKLLEIKTPSTVNDTVLKSYFLNLS